MSLEKFKAAFLTKKKLNKRLRTRAHDAMSEIEHARVLVETLPEDERVQAIGELDALENRVWQEAGNAMVNPGDAWVAMGEILKEAERKKSDLVGRDTSSKNQDFKARFDRASTAAREGLTRSRLGLRGIAEEKELNRLTLKQDDLAKRAGQTEQAAGPQAAQATRQLCEQMEALRFEAGELVREVRVAQGLAPQPGTERANSRAVVTNIQKIEVFGKRLGDPKRDPQGRTGLQEVEGRLSVFDECFAGDEEDDEEAPRRNRAMRLAVVTSVTSDRIARDLNDPYLIPRIGQSLVNEYAPEMIDAVAPGEEDDEDVQGSIILAQALVMDDPLTKLMTGKLDPIDAVQRIRDMAAVGGEPPSVMFKLLRQQFEMKIGSLNSSEVIRGEKENDQNTNGNFDLGDITGELSQGQFNRMVETEIGPISNEVKRRDDGKGIVFKPTSGQIHVAKQGDTLGSLAQSYLGDAGRWQEILEKNKILLVDGQQHDLQTTGANDALPKGARLTVPGKLSLLDQLEPYIKAWDDPKKQGEKEPSNGESGEGESEDKGSQENESEEESTAIPKGPRNQITPRDLRKAFAKLRSPREQDPNYIQPSGLGQEHAPRKPLGNTDEEEALHGQINSRQYAHLRLLARSDEEDREAVLAKFGKPVEEVVAEKIQARYGNDRVSLDLARKIAKAAEGWIAKVPLTVTFTADRMFSDPTKNAPRFGDKAKSDVELTRGTEKMKDLIGKSQDEEESEEESQEENKKPEQVVGTQGGSKTVTGWKDRGANYMRWRRDKDDREGRHDELAPEDQQIFGAANPSFSKVKGGTEGSYGTNYYGSAHFLLKDSVRNRCAFIIRGSGTTAPVQRKNIGMMLFDMLTGQDAPAKFLDAMMQMATGSNSVTAPPLNWECHLYGGFDMRKDAAAIYVQSDLEKSVRNRIRKYAKANGVAFKSIGSKPNGLDAKPRQDPTQIELPEFPEDDEDDAEEDEEGT